MSSRSQKARCAAAGPRAPAPPRPTKAAFTRCSPASSRTRSRSGCRAASGPASRWRAATAARTGPAPASSRTPATIPTSRTGADRRQGARPARAAAASSSRRAPGVGTVTKAGPADRARRAGDQPGAAADDGGGDRARSRSRTARSRTSRSRSRSPAARSSRRRPGTRGSASSAGSRSSARPASSSLLLLGLDRLDPSRHRRDPRGRARACGGLHRLDLRERGAAALRPAGLRLHRHGRLRRRRC